MKIEKMSGSKLVKKESAELVPISKYLEKTTSPTAMFKCPQCGQPYWLTRSVKKFECFRCYYGVD